MKPWNILVEADIQGAKIQGTLTCHSASEESAKRMARKTFINQLRRAGIWSHIDEINAAYEVEIPNVKDKKTGKSIKKTETKYKKITQYHAPYWEHVRVLEIIEPKSRDLTFPVAELEEAAKVSNGSFTKKRRSTTEVTLDKRKKRQGVLKKKDDQLKKKEKIESNKQNKDDLLRTVAMYFTGDDAKMIKSATDMLAQTYQRIRYALFQIKDKGYNGSKYDLVQTDIDGSKAFRLVKK